MKPSSPYADPTIAKILETLKDPIRLRILLFLIRNGPTNVGDIASQFQITRPAISHHLRILKDGQTANSEKRGQEVFYSANTRLVAQALRELADRLDAKAPTVPPSKKRGT